MFMASSSSTSSSSHVDITGLCKSAVHALGDNKPMVHSDHFSLYDSMSAIELMEPKMDQCCGIDVCTKMEKLLEISLDKPLTARDAITVLAILMNLEAAYLDGTSIPESFQQCKLFWPDAWAPFEERNNTCVFSRILLTYCKMLYRSIFYCHKGITFADIYEDEDFSPATTPSLEIRRVDESAIMMEYEALLNILNGHSDGILNGHSDGILNGHSDGTGNSNSLNEFDFIISALTFRKEAYEFYKAFYNLVKQSITYQQDFQDTNHAEDWKEPDFVQLGDHCSTAIYNLVEIVKSLRGMIEPLQLEGISCVQDTHDKNVRAMFSTILLQIMQTNAHRTIKISKLSESLSFFELICDHATQICSFCKDNILTANSAGEKQECETLGGFILGSKSKRINIDTLILTCVDYVDRNMTVLPRSLLWMYFQGFRKHSTLLLMQSLYDRRIPAFAFNYQLVQVWISPSSPLVSTIWSTLRALVTTRGKMLIRMENALSSWAVVLLDARIIDQELHKVFEYDPRVIFFSLYVLVQIATLMDLHMSMLVDSDLLSLNEMDYFYWYWDYIISTKIYALNVLRDCYNRMEQEMHLQRMTEAMSIKTEIEDRRKEEKKKKIKRNPEVRARDTEKLKEAEKVLRESFHPVMASADELFMHMKGNLCRATYKSYVALGLLERIASLQKNEYPFGPDWAGRFDQRFIAFANIPNPFAPQKYQDFLNTVDKLFYHEGTPVTPETVLESVEDAHKKIKDYLENMRVYNTIATENEEIAGKKITILGPQDILPAINCMKLFKTSVVSGLNTMKLQKILKNMPDETCTIKLNNDDNSGSSGSYLKYFKFPVVIVEDRDV